MWYFVIFTPRVSGESGRETSSWSFAGLTPLGFSENLFDSYKCHMHSVQFWQLWDNNNYKQTIWEIGINNFHIHRVCKLTKRTVRCRLICNNIHINGFCYFKQNLLFRMAGVFTVCPSPRIPCVPAVSSVNKWRQGKSTTSLWVILALLHQPKTLFSMSASHGEEWSYNIQRTETECWQRQEVLTAATFCAFHPGFFFIFKGVFLAVLLFLVNSAVVLVHYQPVSIWETHMSSTSSDVDVAFRRTARECVSSLYKSLSPPSRNGNVYTDGHICRTINSTLDI